MPLHIDLLCHIELVDQVFGDPQLSFAYPVLLERRQGRGCQNYCHCCTEYRLSELQVLREHAGALGTTAVTPPGSETGSGGEKIGGVEEGGTQVPGFTEQGSFLAHWFH